MIYNISFMDNATNPLDLIKGINSVISNSYDPYLISYLILLSFFLIFLSMSFRYDFVEVLVIDGFLSTLIAILMYGAGMLPAFAISYPAIIFFLALLFNFFRG